MNVFGKRLPTCGRRSASGTRCRSVSQGYRATGKKHQWHVRAGGCVCRRACGRRGNRPVRKRRPFSWVFGTLRASSGSTGVNGIGMGVTGSYQREHDLRLRSRSCQTRRSWLVPARRHLIIPPAAGSSPTTPAPGPESSCSRLPLRSAEATVLWRTAVDL
jgi:hypothetical protein